LATHESWSPDEASVRRLVARLAGEGRALLAETASLLGAEARGRLADLRLAAVLVAAAGGTLLVGLVVASAAAVAALARAMPLWTAALVVAAGELAVGSILARLAVARLHRMASRPDQTLEVLQEGVRSLRTEPWPRRPTLSEAVHAPSHRFGEPPA
jgi:hypothetical protein